MEMHSVFMTTSTPLATNWESAVSGTAKRAATAMLIAADRTVCVMMDRVVDGDKERPPASAAERDTEPGVSAEGLMI